VKTLQSRLKTEICSLLGIDVPIILAGMAGGPTTESLVAEVSNAGGLGTLGAAYLSPEVIKETVRKIRQLTQRPFAVNLFVPSIQQSNVDSSIDALQGINHIRSVVGLPPQSEVMKIPNDNFDEQVSVLLSEKVPVISTAFGVLPKVYLEQAHALGIKIITMVTSVEEALAAEKLGSDLLVAQGSEAGGHRGTFEIKEKSVGHNIGTFTLLPQIVDHVKIPVIAAGGIMDGRGLIAALALGAQGIQMGTRFLTALESGAHPAYKKALLQSKETDTEITKGFSGRPARGISNKFIKLWKASNQEPFPFPIQNEMTKEIRKAAAEKNDPEFMSLWAGQGLRMLREGYSARAIIQEIVNEAEKTIDQLRY
jgi:nitronate monooxygenase